MASNLEPKINRIATAVTSALSALTAKGVTVPEGANVESLAALIESIQAGGGDFSIQSGTITFAESYKPGSTPLVISHSLNKTPFAFIAYNGSQGSRQKYQIAFIYKLSHCKLSYFMRSGHSTIMYPYSSGSQDLSASSGQDIVTLSASDITVSGGGSATDFNPDAGTGVTSTLVWFAIAEN